ncbi:MAG: carbohydrate-binding protein [Eubacterium sp.]|nr:carbohydrate-binding protein [Eubacterium sp.]
MRSLKKGLAITMSMALALSAMAYTPASAAKKPALTKKSASIKVGKTVKIKVKNAKKSAKVTWKSSKKSVAKITKSTKKGNASATVKGLKVGKSTITALCKMGKKTTKMKCKVTVTKAKKVTTTPTPIVTQKPTTVATATATAPTSTQSAAPTATTTATTEPDVEPTPTPEPTPKQTLAPTTQDYSYFNDYTIGWSGKIVAYKDGKKATLEEVGAKQYNQKTDNIFGQHIENNNWYDDKITLTAPMQYTTADGVAHDIDSMLTNYSFIADPTAIDNSENDGKLYMYATTEGIDYKKGKLATNGYNNHSLTILSTEDMVNWTDEGRMDTGNLTNEVSTSKDKVKCGWATKAWAPSGLKIDGDGDGEDEYYLFYTNSGAVGYVMGDSPTGPWKDPLGKTLFTQQSPNCSGVVWCFDPAVLVDDKGDAYVYFGGGTTDNKAHGKTGRVCKIKFKEGTGEVEMDGEPQIMDTYYLFEDSEINQFNGKYYYSYCTNFNVPNGDKWIGSGQIACYVSSDPMDISFDPADSKGDKYTDSETGVYHHYLGTILNNPSTIYGESYNNHHHMQSFKGKNYMFYHSTVLGNNLYRDNKQYRNMHVADMTVNEETDEIKINPTYEGPSQIQNFDPYKDTKGKKKYINATTVGSSAGVDTLRDDTQVKYSINGSPMVLNNIDTGDWTCIKKVDFGQAGCKSFGAEVKVDSDVCRIELFIDDPTKLANQVGAIDIMESTNGNYVIKNVKTTKAITGVHDVYFVFRGYGFNVASWMFSENENGETPDVSDRPVVGPTATPDPNAPVVQYGWNADKTEYKLKLDGDNVTADGSGVVDFNTADDSVTIAFPSDGYPGVWFAFPEESTNFSSIVITYKDSSTEGLGKAVTYVDTEANEWGGRDDDLTWNGLLPDDQTTATIELTGTREFEKFKLFRNEAPENCKVTITSVTFKK